MSELSLRLIAKDWDHLVPLACGDVVAENLDLKLERDSPHALDRFSHDSTIQAGEMSFSRHLIRLANGDRSFVGIPVFPMRAFLQRSFFVRRDSGLRDLADLAGQRIGTNEWASTGNTWGRAMLRERGVRIDGLQWLVGPIEPGSSAHVQDVLPPYVQASPPGRWLRDLLVEGELDALMCLTIPKGIHEANSPIVRLLPDYRRAERQYYRRTGVYPAHHLIGIRRELLDQNPWVARSLYLALDRSRLLWQEKRRQMAETTPWLLADLEETTALMGPDWQPGGVQPNRKTIQTLCNEEYEQGFIAAPLDPAAVFTEFEEVMRGG